MQSKSITSQVLLFCSALTLITISSIWAASGIPLWGVPSISALLGAAVVLLILIREMKYKAFLVHGASGEVKRLIPVDNEPSSIAIGASYRDRITGFEGIAIGFVKYITGCNQVLLSPQVSADGSLRSSEWFDVQRVVDTGAGMVVLDNGSTPGADRAAPKK